MYLKVWVERHIIHLPYDNKLRMYIHILFSLVELCLVNNNRQRLWDSITGMKKLKVCIYAHMYL